MKGNIMNEGNSGDHSEVLRTSDAEKNEETLDMVQSRLQQLKDLTGPAQAKEAPEIDDDDPNLEEDPEASELDDGSDPGNDDGNGERQDGKDGKDAGDDTDVPDIYIQAAVRSGWKQDDIDSFIEKDPKLAESVFSNLYLGVNQLSREYSAMGRAKQQMQQQQQAAPKTGEKDTGFKGVDIESLKKEYGDDSSIIDGVVKPLNDALIKLSGDLSAMQQQPVPNANVAGNFDDINDPVVRQQTNAFFDSDTMQSYSDFYGKLEGNQDNSHLDIEQRRRRWDVIVEADAMLAGYAASGKYINPEEAMMRAHLLVTEPVREKAIRNNIKATVTKRNKSMTLRPSKGTRTSQTGNKFGDGKPRNRKELVSSVADKLDNLFNN